MNDLQARKDAATVFDRNLVVLAGAGTGKTSLLVERFLNLLGAGHAGIEQLTAITYTEKAAGEMRTRLAAGLEKLLELTGKPGDREEGRDEAHRSFDGLVREQGLERKQVHARILDALRRIDQVQVVTMHAFCGNLLRSFPVEAGIDPGFQVDTGDRFATIQEEEWPPYVAGELSEKAPRRKLWEELLPQVELESIREAAFGLASFSTPREVLDRPAPEIDPRTLLGEPVRKLLGDLERLLDRRTKEGKPSKGVERTAALAGGFRLFLEEGLERLREHAAGNEDLRDLLNLRSLYRPSSAKGFEGVDAADLKEVLKSSQVLLREMLEADDVIAGKILRIAAPFAHRVRDRLLREGFLTFDAMTRLTRDLLLDRPEVRRAVRRKIRTLMVDEFQDTDPVLYDIVLLLAETVEGKAADPYQAELEPGRLFVVGDAKQSIYRFRGADYSAFRRAVERIEEQGGRVLHLTTNFRTVPEILEPVNRLFRPEEGGSWVESDCQPPYVPIDPFAEPGDGSTPKVEVWSTEGERRLNADARRKKEAETIADELQGLVREHGRGALAKVSILLRKWTGLPIYLRELRAREIPYVVDGGKGFMERPEVTVFLTLARTLARPADSAALLGYLRSPVGAVSDRALARYAQAGGSWDHRNADPDLLSEHPEVQEAFDILARIGARIRDLPADLAIQAVLRESKLHLTSALAFEGSQRIANLEKLCAQAAELGRDGRLSLAEMIDALQDERVSESDTESPMADERTEAVRILTVHKAKGLENDIIIIPDLSSGSTTRKPGRVIAVPQAQGTVFGAALQVAGIRNLLFVRHRMEEAAHLAAENLRLLYVAITRPRKRLILIDDPDHRSDWALALDPLRTRADGEVLFRNVLEGKEGGLRLGERPVNLAANRHVEPFRAAVKKLEESLGPPFDAPSRMDHLRAAPAEEPDGNEASLLKRERSLRIGLAVHQALERWDPDREDLPPVLDSHGEDPCPQDGEEVRELLDRFARGPLEKKLRDVRILGRELPMLLMNENGRRWRGVIDLLYQDADGNLVVADYKTDAGLTEEQARERYRDQLRVYGETVRRAAGLERPVGLELWMIRDGRIVPV